MLEIKTNQLKTRKRVLIDDQEYYVRRMGNIEQLEVSQYMRRLNKLAEIEKTAPLTDQQIDEVDQLSTKIMAISIGLFDDGGDGSKSKALLSSLNDTEIGLLLDQIFEDENEPAVS